jgi:hypothetical protein
MIIQCKNCSFKCGTPQATSGIFTILPAMVVTGILCGMLAHHIGKILALLAALPIWFFFSWILWELPRWLTFLRYGLRRCPKCGARSWNRPRYSGFGL